MVFRGNLGFREGKPRVPLSDLKNIISVIIFYIGRIAQMKSKKKTRKVKLRGFPASSDIGRKNIEGAKRVKN